MSQYKRADQAATTSDSHPSEAASVNPSNGNPPPPDDSSTVTDADVTNASTDSDAAVPARGGVGRDDPPRWVFEVRIATGSQGRSLRVEQARVLREVMAWVARKRSETGLDNAA